MSDPTREGPEPMSRATAQKLLELLSSDDAYRTRFQKDPVAALSEVGYTDASAGQCLSFQDGATLASKEDIRQASRRLEGAFVSRFAFLNSQMLSGR